MIVIIPSPDYEGAILVLDIPFEILYKDVDKGYKLLLDAFKDNWTSGYEIFKEFAETDFKEIINGLQTNFRYKGKFFQVIINDYGVKQYRLQTEPVLVFDKWVFEEK